MQQEIVASNRGVVCQGPGKVAVDQELAGRDYFVGDELTGVDIQLSFVAQICPKFCGRDALPNITAFVDRIEACPAYPCAIENGGA